MDFTSNIIKEVILLNTSSSYSIYYRSIVVLSLVTSSAKLSCFRGYFQNYGKWYLERNKYVVSVNTYIQVLLTNRKAIHVDF